MLSYRIAGHIMQFESEREASLHRLLSNYHPFGAEPAAGEAPLLRIRLDDVCGEPLREAAHSYPYDLTEDGAVLKTYPDRYRLEIACRKSGRRFAMDCPAPALFDAGYEAEDGLQTSDGRSGEGSRRAEVCRLLTDRPHYIFRSGLAAGPAPAPRNVIDHMAVFALSLAALGRRTLLLHASAVVCRGRAVLFLGESGTGKSTHSRLWLENIPGTELLNDDAPAVRITDSRLMAYGTPWSGKTPCYRPACYPVSALVRLRQSPENRIERLGGIAAFGALLPSCLPTLQQRPSSLDLVCAALSDILLSVPVYRLDCRPDAEAARTAYEAVMMR